MNLSIQKKPFVQVKDTDEALSVIVIEDITGEELSNHMDKLKGTLGIPEEDIHQIMIPKMKIGVIKVEDWGVKNHQKLSQRIKDYIVKNISAPSNATYKGEIIFNSKDDNHKHLTRFRLLVGDQHITVWKTDDDVKCVFDIGVDEND